MTLLEFAKLLPPKVLVGGVPWDIKVHDDFIVRDDNGQKCWGLCRLDRGIIEIACPVKLNPAKYLIVDTLVHEINHAIWSVWEISHKDKEERIVSQMAKGWVSVYAQNPWLTDWIKKGVK